MSVPSPPAIVVAPLASPNTLEFAWERPVSDGGSPITGYRFQLNSDPAVTLDASTFYYMVTGLTNSQTYFATIEAQNANGFSSKASFRPFEPGSPPNPPATASAAVSGTSNALVSWTPPTVTPDSTIFWYVINSISNNISDPTLKITANGLTQSNYLIENLNRNSQYSFDVQAVNCPGYSSALRTNTIQWFSSGQAKLATRIGGSLTFENSSITVDTNGNVYQLLGINTAGSLSIYNNNGAPTGGGNVPTTLYGTISSISGSVLIKYDSAGTVQWVSRLPGRGETASIATDSSGDVYVSFNAPGNPAPTFYNTATPATTGGTITISTYGTINPTSGYGQTTQFLVKYTSAGTGSVAWITRVEGNATITQLKSLNVDASGNSYMLLSTDSSANRVSNGATASGGVINPPLYGTYSRIGTIDSFLIKYNSSGVAQWLTSVANIHANSQETYGGVVANASGDVYMCIAGNGSMTVYRFNNVTSGTINVTSWGTISTSGIGSGRGGIIVKYGSSGTTASWATRIIPQGTSVLRFPISLSVDSSNNLYFSCTCAFAGTFNLYNYQSGGGSGGGVTTVQYGTIAFIQVLCPIIIKYNSSGTILWATNNSSGEGNSDYYSYKSVCDNDGNFYLAAYGGNRFALRNYTSAPPTNTSPVGLTLYGYVPRLSSSSGQDVYIVKYNSSGSVVWGARVAGPNEDKDGTIYMDNQGNVWVTGIYGSTDATINDYSTAPVSQGDMGLTTFGVLPVVTATNGKNAFLVKYTA
jgi:hypothetical protein